MKNVKAVPKVITWVASIVIVACFAGGCLQEKSHITIHKDGSGKVETDLMIPKATMEVIDSTLGGMMQGMAAMAQGMGADASEVSEATQQPMSEMMFGSKDEIFKKADKVGLGIEFLRFDKEMTEEGLSVNYAYNFDDINKLLQTDLISTGFELVKDEGGNFICMLRQDEQKARESKGQLEQFKMQDQFKEPDDPIAKAMVDAMRNFKIELYITMPNEITETSGVFKQQDSRTAYFRFSGDLMTSPELLDQLYGMTSEVSRVVCSAEGVVFDIDTDSYVAPENTAAFSGGEESETVLFPLETGKTKVYLKDGTVIKGTIVAENERHVKIEVASGFVVTYPREEIEKVE